MTKEDFHQCLVQTLGRRIPNQAELLYEGLTVDFKWKGERQEFWNIGSWLFCPFCGKELK